MTKKVSHSGRPKPTFHRYQGVPMAATRKVPSRKMMLVQFRRRGLAAVSISSTLVSGVVMKWRAFRPCSLCCRPVRAGRGYHCCPREPVKELDYARNEPFDPVGAPRPGLRLPPRPDLQYRGHCPGGRKAGAEARRDEEGLHGEQPGLRQGPDPG